MEIYEHEGGIDSELNFEVHHSDVGQEYIDLEFDHISDSYIRKYGKYTDNQIERRSRSNSIDEVTLPFSKYIIT
jgi:hypothetical protein